MLQEIDGQTDTRSDSHQNGNLVPQSAMTKIFSTERTIKDTLRKGKTLPAQMKRKPGKPSKEILRSSLNPTTKGEA